MGRVAQAVVFTAKPVVGGHAQEKEAARLEHAPDLLQRRKVAGDPEVVDDLETGGDIKRCPAKGQAFDGRASQAAQAASASRLERGPAQVDADDFAKAAQLDPGASGAAARANDP